MNFLFSVDLLPDSARLGVRASVRGMWGKTNTCKQSQDMYGVFSARYQRAFQLHCSTKLRAHV